MGRQSFYDKVQATSMNQAYNNACEDANDEYGHQQGYSGQINATHGYSDRTSHFKASGLSLSDYIDKYQNSFDSEACGICIKEVFKGTRKWELVYVVTLFGGDVIGSKDNKADAVTLARNHTEKTKERTNVHIERKLVGSNSRVAVIEYKGSTNEQQGTYVFFGLARC
jgi:hypothetical protein